MLFESGLIIAINFYYAALIKTEDDDLFYSFLFHGQTMKSSGSNSSKRTDENGFLPQHFPIERPEGEDD